ncbi:PEP/pyruvate-binding domain-containing protein [Vibrio penaeicida]|uniref:PEP/pyruvate-binding domain-containing protein n=1 Tax=Vibrio penaeicida TaxID=104609 RepID=UPI00295EFFDB|nr:PEP/pyruvate-binding domain-containing protein [Vibrio penaeicida]
MKKLAIRSSADIEDGCNKSWAGQFESHLDIDDDGIENSILACWSSLFSERVVDYSHRNGYTIFPPKMAIVIQEMIPASISGVLFTSDPQTMQSETIIIEYCEGLGEKLVSGNITPEVFKFKKADKDRIESISKVLGVSESEASIFISRIIEHEEISSIARDVEWAVYNGKIYLLQNRAITTISNKLPNKFETNEESWQLHLARNMSVFHNSLMIEGHYMHSVDFGIVSPVRFLSITASGTQTKLYAEEKSLMEYSESVTRNVLSDQCFSFISRTYSEKITVLNNASQNMGNKLTPDSFKKFCDAYRELAAGLSLTIIGGQSIEKIMNDLLVNKYMINESTAKLVIGKLSKIEDKSPYEMAIEELKSIKLKAKINVNDSFFPAEQIDIWVEKFKHISVNFCERPLTNIDAIEIYNNIDTVEPLSLNSVDQILLGEWSNDEELITLAEIIKKLTILNERRKEAFCIASLALQRAFKELALEYKVPTWKDFFRLSYKQMNQVILGDIELINGENNEEIVVYFNKDLVVKRLSKLDLKVIPSVSGFKDVETHNGEKIKGYPVSRGIVIANVKCVNDQNDFYKVKRGDIIVSHMTSVDFCPLFDKVSGIITEEGGMTSHAAVVAREYEIPCVVGVKEAISNFKDGDLIKLCGNTGEISIVHTK